MSSTSINNVSMNNSYVYNQNNQSLRSREEAPREAAESPREARDPNTGYERTAQDLKRKHAASKIRRNRFEPSDLAPLTMPPITN